ncbi:hypothetical protein LGR54_24635 [Ancylobacter sp. Lp-2]|uniref:hypothetical protein n=1 Tax=Ancylobacter sp. Lp-2 TaxID=2881339 RepID=UPI001E3C4670|nr:hypothetical protein [Ancylobacter sp. Lp-2]MCB4771803.1 hypothetical protein [Ancylobacter sp. Lp-2]
MPTPLTSTEIASILLSTLTGTASDSWRIGEYLDLHPLTGGPSLVETMAVYVNTPDDFFELAVDAFTTAAVLTFRAADRGIRTTHFADREPRLRPAIDRFTTLPAGTLVELAAAIKSCPPVRAGRRRVAARWASPMEAI